MNLGILEPISRRFWKPLAVLAAIQGVGTVGYKIIGGTRYDWIDCLYMTFITIATIGYAEVVDLSQSPVGRAFTMLIAFLGIGTTWYIFSTMTAYIVGGEINTELRRRKMTRMIDRLSNHYIVCGVGRVGANVARELAVTGRPHVIIDIHQTKIDAYREHFPDTPWLHGDAADDATLIAAGVGRATGVFAITGDDAKNLVITLSAKQLNNAARVVSRCHDVSFTEKMRRVGADSIVSPDFTGGMRIASSMVRPHVITFLDEMLRSEEALRVEELPLPARLSGRLLGELEPRSREFLVLAVRAEGQWKFNPPDDYVVRGGEVLVFMATPEGRNVLRERLR